MSSWKKPTAEQIGRAVALLSHREHHRHFFDRLENPEWLLALKEKGFFSSPPEPIREESRGTVAFPVWPESRYLARMAKHAPDTVFGILSQIPDTENIRVHDDLVDAALALPPKLAAELVPKAVSWIQTPFHILLPEKLGALVSHLARGGEVEPALKLAQSLLAIREDEPEPFFDLWYYGQILERSIPDLVAAAGAKALTLLCDLLDAANRGYETQTPDDYSSIWRSTIEHPQRMVEDLRGHLVSAIRDAAEQLGKQSPASVPEIVRYLESRTWRVFHRIALHVLRQFPEAAPELVAERLTEPERFDREDYRYEYNLLAQACFSRLRPEDQAKILGWIQKGPPDIESRKILLEQSRGKAATEQEVAEYVKMWQRDRLALLSANLSGDWKQRYEELVAEVGTAPEPVREATAVFVGPTSPKTMEDLRAMTVEAFVDYLKSWVPSGKPFGDSRAGLGREVGALVVSEPERFSAEAERFEGLDPTYVRALIQALWEPAKQKRALNWAKVLTLCRWVVNQPREIPSRQGDPIDQDPDWGWTRKAIANLLSHGFDSDRIPFQLRYQVWEVLEPLTGDPNPTPEDESRYDANDDPASFAINTTRGEAMHAVVRYGLWVRRHVEIEDGKARAAQGFDDMREVRRVLDQHLDPDEDPSTAVRAVYGQWLPSLHFLDPNWVKVSISRLFPTEEAWSHLRDTTWEIYIVSSAPYDEVFEALEGQYRQAIDRLGTSSEQRPRLGNPDSSLAQHLMTQYWRGKLDGDDQAGLLARFYAKADPKLCSWALEFIGRSLRKTSGAVPAEILVRLKKLWTRRLEAVRVADPATGQSEELTSFGWWFESKKFDDGWSVDQLLEVLKIAGKIEPDRLVIERLAELSRAIPAKAVDCLAMIFESDKEGWGPLTWREHARRILAEAIHSADLSANSAAVALVNRFGARGYPEFRDLLP